MDMHPHFPDLTCDLCNSKDIIDTRESYVCRSCGMVLEVQKLEYHRPYEESQMQYATLGSTQIGSVRERCQHGDSVLLIRLNKVHSRSKSFEETVLFRAERIMKAIFAALHLPEGMKPIVLQQFKEIRAKIESRRKYRAPDKLIPLVIYFVFKAHNLPIQESELLEISKITKREFNRFKLEIPQIFPTYLQRDRQEYILQRIMEVSEHFGLGMEFFHRVKQIFMKFWSILKNTKDDVVAGVVSAISILCDHVNKVSINALCKYVGIQMSTIQSQIKKKIFDHFRISGFVSLIKSADKLRTFILRVLESDHLLIETVKAVKAVKTVLQQTPSLIKAKLKEISVYVKSEDEKYGVRGIKVGIVRLVQFFISSIKKVQKIFQDPSRKVIYPFRREKKVTIIPFKDGKGPPPSSS